MYVLFIDCCYPYIVPFQEIQYPLGNQNFDTFGRMTIFPEYFSHTFLPWSSYLTSTGSPYYKVKQAKDGSCFTRFYDLFVSLIWERPNLRFLPVTQGWTATGTDISRKFYDPRISKYIQAISFSFIGQAHQVLSACLSPAQVAILMEVFLLFIQKIFLKLLQEATIYSKKKCSPCSENMLSFM